MPQFDICFQARAVTKDETLYGSVLGPAPVRALNENLMRNDWLEPGYLGLIEVLVEAEGEGDGDEVTVSMWTMVEATSQQEAERLHYPSLLLQSTAGSLRALGDDGGITITGAWTHAGMEDARPRDHYYSLKRDDHGCLPRLSYVDYTALEDPLVEALRSRHPYLDHDEAVVLTKSPLTVPQLRAYGLAPLIEGADLISIADRITAAGGHLSQHAGDFSTFAQQDPDSFLSILRSEVNQLDAGVRYSIGDIGLLSAMVVRKLDQLADSQSRQLRGNQRQR